MKLNVIPMEGLTTFSEWCVREQIDFIVREYVHGEEVMYRASFTNLAFADTPWAIIDGYGATPLGAVEDLGDQITQELLQKMTPSGSVGVQGPLAFRRRVVTVFMSQNGILWNGDF